DYEALMAEKVLLVYDESKGQAMFVSHQWAGIGHPDPSMKQFRVLQDALKGFLYGRADVPASLSVELYLGDGNKITGAEIASKPLFIWYDYFCCPQAADQTEHRRKAIISIPSYIETCRYFAILCPHVRHEEHDMLLNKHTWAERGWCRLEQVCKEFSMQEATCDAIDIQSSIFQTRAPSYNWVKQPVGEGFFTVDADRRRIAPVLRDMVSTKMRSYLLKAKFHDYRLMLNLQAVHFRGLPLNPIDDLIPCFQSDEQDPAAFILAQFMHQNGFVSYTEHTSEGWAPISYAALSGNPLLISALLQQKADPNECTTMPESTCQFAAKTPCLAICAFLKHNHALRVLLASNADLNAKDGYGATALHWAAAGNNAEGIQILRKAGCDRAIQVPNMLGYSPFAMACAGGGLEAIKELMSAVSQKELTCGLHAALLQGGGSAAVVAELIQAGADINGELSVPLLSPFGLIFACLSIRHFFSQTHLSAYAYHHHRASPLMCSLLSSSFDAAAVLLAAGARCDLTNSRGYTALDLAKETSAPEFITAALSGQPTTCEAYVKEHLHKAPVEALAETRVAARNCGYGTDDSTRTTKMTMVVAMMMVTSMVIVATIFITALFLRLIILLVPASTMIAILVIVDGETQDAPPSLWPADEGESSSVWRHQKVQELVVKFWDLFKKEEDSTILKEAYDALVLRFLRIYLPGLSQETEATLCANSWQEAAMGSDRLDLAKFFQGLVRIAQSWCDSNAADDYVGFLEDLLSRSTCFRVSDPLTGEVNMEQPLLRVAFRPVERGDDMMSGGTCGFCESMDLVCSGAADAAEVEVKFDQGQLGINFHTAYFEESAAAVPSFDGAVQR
ncbi:unnamed protein product, partial [Symbiodinium sp. CCMP2456]